MNFYLLEEEIFNDSFERFYNKGFFGDIEKDDMKMINKKWYREFLNIINERNEVELVHSLINSENKLTREWFSLITGYNIKYLTKNKTYLIIKEFVHGR